MAEVATEEAEDTEEALEVDMEDIEDMAELEDMVIIRFIMENTTIITQVMTLT